MKLDYEHTKKFVTSGIIREHSEIVTAKRGVDLSGLPILRTTGTYSIINAKAYKDRIVFESISVVDGERKNINHDEITHVDGMSVERLLSVYSSNSSTVEEDDE